LRAAIGSGIDPMADYLNVCREKRNELSYAAAHVVTESEATELVQKTQELEQLVESWIGKHHPHLRE